MQFLLRSACVLALVAAPALGQSASFQLYGSGCNGAMLNRCITLNDQNPMLTPANLTNEYAHAAQNNTGGAVTVIGVDFFTATVSATTTVTVPVAFYWDAYGAATTTPIEPSETPQTLGSISVDPTPNWYRGDFDRPVIVPPGSYFWVSADTNGINPPENANGSGSLRVSHWRRPGFVSGVGWNQTTIVANPAYRIRCLGSANVPILVNNGVPRLGSTYSVEIYNAPAAVTGGFHLLGSSRTSWRGIPLPLDLTIIGATSCELLTSINVTLLRPISSGHASVPLRVPNNGALLGASLYHQWLLLAPGVTPVGLLFSGGGEATLGGL